MQAKLLMKSLIRRYQTTRMLSPGQQHMAMDTNPELFVRVVLQFLLV
jgi:hypothetical protein